MANERTYHRADGANEAREASGTSAAADAGKPTIATNARGGLTSFTLKVLAIAGMTCNHACYIFWYHLPEPLLCGLFLFGGLTFPIMAFLLVEGYRHTSNVRRYGQRLLVFALVSQVPYGLFLAHQPNVMFTLLAGLAVLYLYDHLRNRALFWLAFAGVVLATAWCDWGILGPCMVLVLRVTADRWRGPAYSALLPIAGSGLPALSQFATVPTLSNLAFVLYPLVGCTATIPLLASYNGKRGRPMKWFFYAYYPVHITVLGLAKGLLLGDWSLGY